ncbi:hypothetical protein BJ875DRAFT_132873 [Amylocarpus encephaloides]|uniref:SET domain-containing protein n=1 Tax=Amylocarpus encephaloides TaxID=45428 RepID=A0A9P8C239_9HELO|nr:hypothetical protein BJ875DRAFT_132873 [Amylocarpus encephaloides]
MSSTVDKLLHWARSHGTSLHDHVQIYQDNVTGWSFKAARPLPAGTTLVNCSYTTTLSYLNAIEASSQFELNGSDPFPSGFLEPLSEENPNIIGHFFLMQQFLMRERSFWWEYIRLLPQPNQPQTLALPIWWTEADRNFLAGTNAEPPIKKRLDLWKQEWVLGIRLLKDNINNWHDYPYELYQWAATIFGTRSFRASLTLPLDIETDRQMAKEELDQIRDHISQDRFSVLFPVLDIGNHDGVSRVQWCKHPDANHFVLSTTQKVAQGDQIYNFYGSKSNSELLVGYGFTLPTLEQDVVNLKLTPSLSAMLLRRSQACHDRLQRSQAGEEFMFQVRSQTTLKKAGSSSSGMGIFSHGLLEALICMVANQRERTFIEQNRGYCLDKDPHKRSGPLYRALSSAVRILSIKLNLEIKRIEDTGADLGEPKNPNQELALQYRQRKLVVLRESLWPLQKHLDAALAFISFPENNHHTIISQYPDILLPSGLISLDRAFEWLRIQYREIHALVTVIIADDQEEDLPLNWVVLGEDWDHTYWVVWIYLVWLLWARDGTAFQDRHPNMSQWLLEIKRAYSENDQHSYETFHAHQSEQVTIHQTIKKITSLPQFRGIKELLQVQPNSWGPLRNFASLVAKEETMTATFVIGIVTVEQKVLAINQDNPSRTVPPAVKSEILEEEPQIKQEKEE